MGHILPVFIFTALRSEWCLQFQKEENNDEEKEGEREGKEKRGERRRLIIITTTPQEEQEKGRKIYNRDCMWPTEPKILFHYRARKCWPASEYRVFVMKAELSCCQC